MERSTPRTVVLHGHELSYLDSGAGPVVLFIHGILGSQHNWRRLLDRMDDAQRVLVPDLFGHGDSAKPMGDYSLSSHAATLRDLLDRLGIDRVTLVGHSLGGGIAMQFFYLFPERVERLVLVASGGLGREVSPILRSATLPLAEQVLSVVASRPVLARVEAVGRAAGRVGWRPGADIGAIWRGFTSLGDRESRRAFLATTRSVIDLGGQSISAHDHLAEVVPIPVLIVWGTKDRMIPAWHAISAQKAVPRCRVELFEGAGHFPHLEDPDRFAALLHEFIASDGTSPGLPRFQRVRSDDPVVAGLLEDYQRELEGEGIVLHQGEGGSVDVEEMLPPRGAFYLVTVDAEPVACGGVRLLDDDVAEVKRMYVAPVVRGRGVARSLLARLEDDARALRCRAVRLDTGPTMAPAVALYRSAGYQPIEDYNGNPHAGHWFEKALAVEPSVGS